MAKYPLFVMTHALSYFLYQSIALFTMLCWNSADDEFADSRMQCVHISNMCTAVCKVATPLWELTCHMGSQCYLPSGRGDIPALTPAEAGLD